MNVKSDDIQKLTDEIVKLREEIGALRRQTQPAFVPWVPEPYVPVQPNIYPTVWWSVTPSTTGGTTGQYPLTTMTTTVFR